MCAVVWCSEAFFSPSVMAKELDTAVNSDKHLHKKTEASTTVKCAAPCIVWVNPLVKPRMALLCIHGLGLYSGSYQAFGNHMARLGIITYAIDVRGFGSWKKSDGHTNIDLKACLNDVKSALEAIRRANPGLPVFLLGESMGGAIALRTASLYPDLIEGLISSVPAGERFQQKKTDLKIALEYLKGKNKQFDVGTKIVAQATQNEKLRQDWASNPLDRMNLSPNELIQFQSFMNDNHIAAKNVIDDPVLFVQGTQDRLVKPEGTWELFNELTTPDRYFFAVPSEHLIFEEGQDKSADLVRLSAMVSNWMRMVAAENGTIAQNKKNNSVSEQVIELPMDGRVSDAISKLVRGQNDQALPLLEAAVKDNPGSTDAKFWLGVAYARLRRPKDARAVLTEASALATTSGITNQDSAAPNASGNNLAQTQIRTATIVNVDPAVKALTNGKPLVLAFSAPWCEQCQTLDGFFAQAHNMLGENVKLLKIDVDDSSNDALLKLFKVGPIPTVVYLDRNGIVTSTMIGQTGYINFVKGISAIYH